MKKQKKGFTLIELLIVIGILAVLSSVTVLILNPAELLRQARDSQRLNDLSAINNSLATYAATATTVALGSNSQARSHAGFSIGSVFASSTAAFGAACGGVATVGSTTTSTARTVLGSGWIPVNFGAIPGGSPLTVLPVDPSSGIGTASTTADGFELLYWYMSDATNSTWELAAKMESARYKAGGPSDASTNDGGTCSHWYELGSDPALDLI